MITPGRKQTAVAFLFKTVTGNFKIPKVKCNFCGVTVTKKGFRMKLIGQLTAPRATQPLPMGLEATIL